MLTSSEADCTEWVDILNYVIGERNEEGSLEDAYMMHVSFSLSLPFLERRPCGRNPQTTNETITKNTALGISEHAGGIAEGPQGDVLCLGCQTHLLLYERECESAAAASHTPICRGAQSFSSFFFFFPHQPRKRSHLEPSTSKIAQKWGS